MIYLKQSTAVIKKLGPFVDSGDGNTAETGLTISQADIQLSKNGGAFAQTSDGSPTTTHDADGWYPIPLTTTDTGTLGSLVVQITESGALPVWREYMVVPANVYDSLVAGSDSLDVNAEEINASSTAAGALRDWLEKGTRLTSDNGGTTTTLVDAGLTQADDYWNGSLLIFRTGANSGRTAIVTDFDADSDTITFAPAVPNAVATGQGFALIPGLGHSFARIGAAGVGLTSVALAAAGFDSIPTTEPSGVASDFREMVVQTWQRPFFKSTLTATQLKTYKADSSTPATTQAVENDGTTQTVGKAT